MKGLLELGNTRLCAAQFQSALKSYDSLKSIYDKVPELPFQNYGILYLNKGLCYMYMGNYGIAEENFRRALLCNEDVVGDRTYAQLKALVYQNLACLCELTGALDDAHEMYDRSIKVAYLLPPCNLCSATIWRRNLFASPGYFDLQYGLASVELRTKKLKECKERLRETIKRIEELGGDQLTRKLWIRLGLCRYTLGVCYHQLREGGNARTELGKAHEILRDRAAAGEVDERVIRHIERLMQGGGSAGASY